jgi:NTP pyrophosphatase (non-canonical NTP hydrolase)
MSYLTSTGRTLAVMAEEVRKVNIDHGWRTGENTFGDYIALLHSELSEALEAYRDHRLEDATEVVYGNRIPKPEGVGSEFADVLIRLIDTCDIYGINLEAEYARKLAYNCTRPYLHGGRTLNGAGRAVD